jgi:hypothetical protein
MSKILSSKIFITALVFIAVVLFGVFLFFRYQENLIFNNLIKENEALLVIDYGNKERWFKGAVENNMTLKNIFEAASIAGGFNFNVDKELTMLDNVYNNHNNKWTCYLNGSKINSDLENTKVPPRSKIKCVYR